MGVAEMEILAFSPQLILQGLEAQMETNFPWTLVDCKEVFHAFPLISYALAVRTRNVSNRTREGRQFAVFAYLILYGEIRRSPRRLQNYDAAFQCSFPNALICLMQ